MGTLSDRRIVDPVLTELARGYSNSSFVFPKLFPIVPVAKEGGKIPQFNKEAFKIYNTERAIRAKSNRISPDLHTTIDYVCTEHDLEYPIDYREESEDMLNLRQHATNVVTDAILLKNEKSAADIAQTTASYASGNKVTLSGTDQWTNAASDPIDDIETARYAIRAKIAKFPNVAIIGAQAFKVLSHHADVLDKISYDQHSVMTVKLLQTLLNIPNIFVGEAVYETDAGVMTDIWADNMILAFVPQSASKTYYEPSYGYTLRKKGFPFVDKYDEAGKLELIRNTDLLVSKMVGAEAGYIIYDTNA